VMLISAITSSSCFAESKLTLDSPPLPGYFAVFGGW
jgi:hypothetical protein